MFDLGPQSPSESKFIAKRRLHQSRYRREVLMEDFGFGPKEGSNKQYGNMLIDGEVTGSNFISPAAFRYAVQRTLDKAISKYLNINSYRLFNNMLSSQPMCFNLFSDLRELLLFDKEICSEVCKLLFKEIAWISTVEYIGVEFIPLPIEDYINDKTAFDAILVVKDEKGRKGIISIETKYTDLLGSNPASADTKKNKIVKDNQLFSPEIIEDIEGKGYTQIYRNYLLTFAYMKENGYKHFCNTIISPAEDDISKKEISELQNGLNKNKKSIMKIDLEEFIERGILANAGEISKIFAALKQRYVEL